MVSWYFRILELEFRTLFELKSNSNMEDINKSFRGSVFTEFCFHPILDTRNVFVELNY